MSEQTSQQPDIVHEEDGWRAVAEQMHEWHPGLQEHARRNLAERGLSHLVSDDQLTQPRDWHEQEYKDALLDRDKDLGWLESLAGRPIGQDELDRLNQGVITTGSVHINKNTDPLLVQEVLRARNQFYEQLLGWSDERHPLNDTYRTFQNRAPAPPLSTLIRTQRYLASVGASDASLLLRRSPLLLGRAVDSIEATVNHLSQLGVKDIPTLITNNPAAFSAHPDTLDQKVDNLASIGIKNPIALIEKQPALLNKSVHNLKEKIEQLSALGFKDPAGFMEKVPNITGIGVASLQDKTSTLRELGVANPAQLMEKRPNIVLVSPDSVRAKLSHLSELGAINPGRLLEKFPALLSYSSESIDSKVGRLRGMGFGNPMNLLERSPAILGYSPDTLEEKLKSFDAVISSIASDITAVQLIENTPTLLGVADDKINAIATFLSEHQDAFDIGSDSKAISKLFFIPVDSFIGALAQKTDTPLTLARISEEVRSVEPSARREKAINLINQSAFQSILGSTATKAYLQYARLTDEEKARVNF